MSCSSRVLRRKILTMLARRNADELQEAMLQVIYLHVSDPRFQGCRAAKPAWSGTPLCFGNSAWHGCILLGWLREGPMAVFSS
jgi:hypothetical protein